MYVQYIYMLYIGRWTGYMHVVCTFWHTASPGSTCIIRTDLCACGGCTTTVPR